jgi:hypothetical protein
MKCYSSSGFKFDIRWKLYILTGPAVREGKGIGGQHVSTFKAAFATKTANRR